MSKILAKAYKDNKNKIVEQSLLEHGQEVFDYALSYLEKDLNLDKLVDLLNSSNKEVYGSKFNSSLNSNQTLFNKEDILKILFYASFLHDIGKVNPEFQSKLNKEIKKNKEAISKSSLSLVLQETTRNESEFNGDILDLESYISEISNPKSKNFVRHNKLSYILSQAFVLNEDNIEKSFYLKNIIDYIILFHHSRFFYEEDCTEKPLKNFFPKPKNLEKSIESTIQYLDEVLSLNLNQAKTKNLDNLKLNDFIDKKETLKNLTLFFFEKKLKQETFPLYKDYSKTSNVNSIKQNAIKNIFRLFFNKCDRNVSRVALSLNQNKLNLLNKTINFDELNDNKKFPLTDEKTIEQNKVVETILNKFKSLKVEDENLELKGKNKNIVVLDGATGCGKTRIFTKVFGGLKQTQVKSEIQDLNQSSESSNKKMVVVTPRNTISLGLFEDFLKGEYLTDEKLTFEIVNSENQEKGVFNPATKSFERIELDKQDQATKYQSDIIFMSIDHLVKLYNDNSNSFYQLIEEFLVFDEFHEIYEQELLAIQFVELLYVLNVFNKTKMLCAKGFCCSEADYVAANNILARESTPLFLI